MMRRHVESARVQLPLKKRLASALTALAATLSVPILALLVLNPWTTTASEEGIAANAPAAGLFAVDVPVARTDNRSPVANPAVANNARAEEVEVILTGWEYTSRNATVFH
jgi:hypothetical protein